MLQPVSFATRKKIFLEYLNLVHSTKSYLKAVFLEMRGLATNATLLLAIDETGADNLSQIANINAMFASINEHITEKQPIGVKAMNLEAYKAATNVNVLAIERDCAIVFYLQLIESIDALYFKTLKAMAKGLNYDYMNMQYPYDIAMDNQNLLFDIHAEMVA